MRIFFILKNFKILGPEHPSILTTRNNIAGELVNQRKYEALKVYNEVYEIKKEKIS